MIESNLPWGMVLYGEVEENLMATSEDPIIQTIWNEKNVEPFSAIAQIRPVYEGKKIFIDYKSGLESAIFVRYVNPAGDPLIHVASNPVFMPNYPGSSFMPTFNHEKYVICLSLSVRIQFYVFFF